MVLRARRRIAGHSQTKSSVDAEDPLGDWEDRLAKVIAARRAGQEMGKVKHSLYTKSRKVGL